MGMRDKGEGNMERDRDRETDRRKGIEKETETDRNEGVRRPTKTFSGTTASTLQMTSQGLRTISQ